MLVYFFYAVPLVSVLLYGLNKPGCSWMLDWTIFFAGAMAQVQCIALKSFIGILCNVPMQSSAQSMRLGVVIVAQGGSTKVLSLGGLNTDVHHTYQIFIC